MRRVICHRFNLTSAIFMIAMVETLLATQPLLAQSATRRSPLSDDQITQVFFKPPPQERKPQRTSGAGSRQDNLCLPSFETNAPILLPLVPDGGEGLTIATHPTFFVYIPKTSASKAILSIKEDGIRHHSQAIFSIKGTAGIIGFKPEASSPPLLVGKTYQWSLILVCGEKLSPNDPAAVAWVHRIAPPAVPKEKPFQSDLQQAVWYGEQGIWYDMLKAIAQAQIAQPVQPHLTDLWSSFLTSVGLRSLLNQPITFNSNP